jgi:outer membrane protein TolC
MTMRTVGLMQEITRGDKRRLRAERFDLAAEKSEAEKTAAMATIERETAFAWLDRYYAEKTASILAEQAALAKQEVDATDAAYRGGRASQADVLSAKSTLAMIEDKQSELARRVTNARIMLSRWTGLNPDVELAGAPGIDTIRLDPATIDVHFAHHPEIVALSKEAEIAETEAKLAKADKKADWSVEVAYSQRGPGYSNMVSVGVSVPLQWNQKSRQDREWAAKHAMAEQAQAERDEMLRTHIAETRTMINEWQNDRDRLSRYHNELIPLAHDRMTATETAYRGGKTALADVLAARRNDADVRLQALQLEADTARLWAQINFLFPNETASLHTGSVAKDLP